jgi:DoxX-like family
VGFLRAPTDIERWYPRRFEEDGMGRKVAYWASTVLVVMGAAFGAFAYLTASPEAVQGFAHVGYPQQLRVLLGIAKLAGAIALVGPGFPLIKEWAYAGFTFTWIAATVAHYLAGDGAQSLAPVFLLVLLGVSYVTRSDDRRWQARAATA